ncbi:MAG TPA: Hsp20/alpha crystallin family protein [Thermoanaerobaculia bacterium]|jgi:HSP20 family protein|nr:Hsp20/alpha crystallin family protein [Thermoanaerobaculia bacterium]
MTSPRRPRVPVAFVFGVPPRSSGAEEPPLHVPPVDVVEEEAGWRLVFEVPGAAPERLGVEVEGRLVTLRGDRLPTDGEKGRFLRVERVAGPFERTLELPAEPDPEGAKASYADGVLTLFIPRRATPKGRTIPIVKGSSRTN